MIGGDEYLKVARSLLKSKDATDEEIASSTGLRINMVRILMMQKPKLEMKKKS